MIQIQAASGEPIYIQIIEQIKKLVLKQVLQPGDKLPSVRELALLITANPNTVSKAYKELEQEQVVVTIKGSGTFVNDFKTKEANQSLVQDELARLKSSVLALQFLGLPEEECKDHVGRFYADNRKEDGHASN